jgi:YspA, cpYpsA-related SLOG family
VKAIVCGSRDCKDRDLVFAKLDDIFYGKRPEVIHGGARGVDLLAGEWAKSRGLSVVVHTANWEEYGPAAGPRRNQTMLDVESPDLVVAFPGGRGTSDMTRRARARGIKVVWVTNNATDGLGDEEVAK